MTAYSFSLVIFQQDSVFKEAPVGQQSRSKARRARCLEKIGGTITWPQKLRTLCRNGCHVWKYNCEFVMNHFKYSALLQFFLCCRGFQWLGLFPHPHQWCQKTQPHLHRNRYQVVPQALLTGSRYISGYRSWLLLTQENMRSLNWGQPRIEYIIEQG